MPGHSEPVSDTTATAFDHLAQLAGDGSLSRRQILTRALGFAAVALLPSWVPFARAKRGAAGILDASISISDSGKCPPRARGKCGDSYTEVGPWTPACKATVPSDFRPEFNGCGPAKWGKLSWLLRTLARAADRPALLTSFTKGCNEHDCCYGTCHSSKTVCDDRLRASLLQACNQTAKDISPLGPVLSLTYKAYCESLADSFYLLVAKTPQGRDAFRTAQEEVCVCCEGERETGPCGGRTCGPGELCCRGRSTDGTVETGQCYDPRMFACCNLTGIQFCPISGGTETGQMYCYQVTSPPYAGRCEFVPASTTGGPCGPCEFPTGRDGACEPVVSEQCSGPFPAGPG